MNRTEASLRQAQMLVREAETMAACEAAMAYRLAATYLELAKQESENEHERAREDNQDIASDRRGIWR